MIARSMIQGRYLVEGFAVCGSNVAAFLKA